MDFNSFLKVNASKIDEELDEILSQFLSEVKKTSPKLLPLALGFLNSCKGGKRIRGVLVKLGYEIAKGKKTNEIFKIGAALEILHTAILVHDDIIDQSPQRRGQPSLYKTVGESLALTLGDLGFFLAIKIITESNFPENEKNKALNSFSKTMIDTAIGQIMDIEKDDPVTVAKFKTAQYTISGPLILGAILAGAKEQLIRELGEFGENSGIAFQIQDDILDGENDWVDAAEKKALQYVSLAKKMIPEITTDKRMEKLLEEMAEYLIERTK